MASPGGGDTSYRKDYLQSCRAVAQARRELAQFARSCGFSGQALADIEMAVGEGLANAVEHGYHPAGSIEVVARCCAGTLVVEIKDSGSGFDHRAVRAGGRPPDGARGFGTSIMRSLMDEVSYSEGGTRLELRKRLPVAAPRGSAVEVRR